MDELLNGSPAHNPISAAELVEWGALYKLRAHEAEKAAKKRR